jgi:hypothetical protein
VDGVKVPFDYPFVDAGRTWARRIAEVKHNVAIEDESSILVPLGGDKKESPYRCLGPRMLGIGTKRRRFRWKRASSDGRMRPYGRISVQEAAG